ncbi:MAG: 7-cyano-7-deazaguanine synthase QueC [Pseudomonadota bacterium]
MSTHPQSALVLFSGGQDSATCLAWALARYDRVETVGFDYGQRHAVELTAREAVREAILAVPDGYGDRLGQDHLLDLGALGAISETAMTRPRAIEMNENGLPNTFVPGRNLVFLVMAAALAHRRGAAVLVGGMCETDFSGYPDCRQETLDRQMEAIRLGMAIDLDLETPLMLLTKAQSWHLAEDLGGATLVEIIRTKTHTCYLGERGTEHDWGYGCGHCPACALRRAGWEAYAARRAMGPSEGRDQERDQA